VVILLAGAALAGRVGGEPNRPQWRWHTIETAHYRIFWPDSRRAGDPVAAEATADRASVVAEQLWLPLAVATGYWPRTPINIVVRDDGDALAGHAVPAWHQVVISVHPGQDLARARGRTDLLELVLAHELGHVFTQAVASPLAWPATVGPEIAGVGAFEAGAVWSIGGALALSGSPPSGWSEGSAELAADAVGVATWTPERAMTLRMAALGDHLPTWEELQLAPEGDLWGDGERRYQAAYSWGLSLGDAYRRVGARVARRWRPRWDGAFRRELGETAKSAYDTWRDATELAAEDFATHLDAAGRVEGPPTEGEPKPRADANLAWWPKTSSDGRWRGDERGSWLGLTPTDGGDTRWIRAAGGGGYCFVPHADAVIAVMTHRPGTPEPRRAWSRLFRVDLTNHGNRGIEEIAGTERASEPAVSPDGTRLAWLRFSDGSHRVVVAGMDGSSPVALDSPAGARLSGLSWSPDGTRLVTAAFWRGTQELWEIPADGSPARALTDDPPMEDDPWWAPDGSIWFDADVDGVTDVFRLDGTTRGVERVTRVIGGAATPSVDPDGTLRYAEYDPTGWRPHTVAAAEQLRAPQAAFAVDPPPREAAPAPPPAPVSERYHLTLMPPSVIPVLRLDGASFPPSASVPVLPRGGAWLQTSDALEDHVADLLVLLGEDLVVAGGYTLRRFGPDFQLSGSHAERHGDDAPAGVVRVDRAELDASIPLLGPLSATLAGSTVAQGGVDRTRGASAQAGLIVADRRVDWSGTATAGASGPDSLARWTRLESAGTLRIPLPGDPVDHRIEIGGAVGWTDRELEAPLRLYAGGDHPAAWYTASLQRSARFPAFAPYSLVGDDLAIATAGWQLPLVSNRAARLGPITATDLLIWLGGDAGNVWPRGAVPELLADAVAEIRWRAVLASSPWDGAIRGAWAPGEPIRVYASLGAGW
jgi:hypothetical protein